MKTIGMLDHLQSQNMQDLENESERAQYSFFFFFLFLRIFFLLFKFSSRCCETRVNGAFDFENQTQICKVKKIRTNMPLQLKTRAVMQLALKISVTSELTIVLSSVELVLFFSNFLTDTLIQKYTSRSTYICNATCKRYESSSPEHQAAS